MNILNEDMMCTDMQCRQILRILSRCLLLACKHGCCANEIREKSLLSAWKTALIILLVCWEYRDQTHIVFSLHVTCPRSIKKKEAVTTEMWSLVTRRFYGQVTPQMVCSHRERHEKATETKRRMQKEASIKDQRIKSNKTPKAANKGAASCECIYNAVQFFPSRHAFRKTYFFFFFFLLLSDMWIHFKRSSQYLKLKAYKTTQDVSVVLW